MCRLGLSNELNHLITEKNWKSVVDLCQSDRRQAKSWSIAVDIAEGNKTYTSRALPIHLACALLPPQESIDSIVKAYPSGVRLIESKLQRLPIHIACRNRSSPEVIHTLLGYYPESAGEQDIFRRLPLHYAVSNGAPIETIDALLVANSCATQHQDERGWLPIHLACRKGASAYVIQKLLFAYPQSLNVKTSEGLTPLLCIKAAKGTNREVIMALFMTELDKNPKLSNSFAPQKKRASRFSGSKTESRIDRAIAA